MKKSILITLILLTGYSALAEDYTWNGGGFTDNWSNPANWTKLTPGTYPDDNNDQAIFDTVGGPVIIDVSVVDLGTLTILGPGAPTITMNPGCTLSLDSAGGYNGDFSMAVGTFNQSETMSVDGTFTITGGAFNNNAALTVAGRAVFNIPGGTLSLANPNNNFYIAGGIDVQNLAYLTIADTTSLLFLRININDPTAATGDLVVTSGTQAGSWAVTFDNTLGGTSIEGDLTVTIQNGNITNTAGTTVTIGGNAHFTASTYISMDGLNVNGASTIELDSGTYATIVNANTVNLTNSTIGTNLDVTSTNGSITDFGLLDVTGTSTFRINTAGQDVLLNNPANRFVGTLAFTPNPGPINDIEIYDTTALAIPAIDITGYLDARTTGAASNITNSGVVRVDLTGTFQANTAGATITLGGAVNILDVGGDITLVTAGGDANIRNAQHIQFNNTSITGSLTARADAGDITDNSAVNVTVNSTFWAANAQNIYLNNTGNSFGGTLAFNPIAGSITNIVIYDTTPIAIPAIDILGYLDAQTFGAPGGAITNSGIVRVDLTGTFQANTAGFGITLGAGANLLDITGNIRLVTVNGNADITNIRAITFTNTNVNGTLTAAANTAAVGNIAQANAMTVTGAAHFTNSIAGGDIVLTTATNAFGGTVEFDTTTPNGDVTFVNNGPVTFNPAAAVSDVNGALNASAVTGSITETAASSLDVEGASTFAAAATFDILLNQTANRFTGAIDFNAYGAGPVRNIELYDTTDVILQVLQTSGYLIVTTGPVPGPGGDITDSGNLVVGGYAHFTTLVADDLINLPDLQVVGTIELDTTGANGDAVITNNQNIEFLNTSVGGDLTAAATTAAGSISANIASPVTVLGNAHFTTSGAGADIDFSANGTLAVTGTIELDTTAANGDASIINANGIAFGGASVVNGALTAAATLGDITDPGSLAVTGMATFSAGANLITLDTLGNSLPTVTIASGANVTLACSSTINLTTAAAPDNPTGLTVNVGGAGCVLAGALDLNGSLLINGGVFDVGADRQINITGDWSNNGGAGTFQERAGTVIFDGAAGRMVSSETFNNLTVWTGFTLDVNGTNLQASGLFNIQNGAILYRNGTTVPIVERAPRDPDSGRVCYRNAGGNVEEYPAGVDYWDLEIAAGAFLLTGNTDIDNSLFLSGGTLDATATPYNINIGGNWVDTAGNFLCQTGTVTFDSLAVTDQYITGTTTFYNFVCIIPGKNLYFGAGETTTIATNGRFRIIGLAGTEIHLRTNTIPTQWLIEMSPGSILEMQYVIVHYSYAVNVIITPPDVDASDNCTRWIATLNVSSVDTVDFDNNGKIDCLHVTAAANVNDDFSGLMLAMIDDYAINTILGPVPNGVTTGVNPLGPVLPGESQDDEFYVWLVEKPYLDTSSTPDFRITANSTLYYNALPPQYLVWGPTVYNPIDLADPVIGYTLARADNDQVYVHLSEPVRDAGLAPVTGANFLYGGAIPATTAALIGTREYLLTYPALTFVLADIAGGNTITFQNIVDLAVAPNQLQGAASVTHPLSDIILNFTGHEAITLTSLYDPTPRDPGPEGIGYITRFDGSEWLNFPVGALTFAYTDNVGGSGDLAYYIDTANTYQNLPLWYPTPPALGVWVYGLVPQYQAGVLTVNPGALGAVAFVNDSLFEFYVRYPGPNLLCGRLALPAATDWYRSVKPFAFGVHTPGGQKGGVEIYKNVINPTRGEITKIRYTLNTAGNVTVQVFNLNGDIVDVLYTGWLAAGVHSTTWDGRNRGNRITARGLYFIKVVGPGIDETRKVLVVK